jgi:hypothetical protein
MNEKGPAFVGRPLEAAPGSAALEALEGFPFPLPREGAPRGRSPRGPGGPKPEGPRLVARSFSRREGPEEPRPTVKRSETSLLARSSP